LNVWTLEWPHQFGCKSKWLNYRNQYEYIYVRNTNICMNIIRIETTFLDELISTHCTHIRPTYSSNQIWHISFVHEHKGKLLYTMRGLLNIEHPFTSRWNQVISYSPSESIIYAKMLCTSISIKKQHFI